MTLDEMSCKTCTHSRKCRSESVAKGSPKCGHRRDGKAIKVQGTVAAMFGRSGDAVRARAEERRMRVVRKDFKKWKRAQNEQKELVDGLNKTADTAKKSADAIKDMSTSLNAVCNKLGEISNDAKTEVPDGLGGEPVVRGIVAGGADVPEQGQVAKRNSNGPETPVGTPSVQSGRIEPAPDSIASDGNDKPPVDVLQQTNPTARVRGSDSSESERA